MSKNPSKATDNSDGAETGKASWLPGILILIITAVLYVPVLDAGFIWDDDDYVTENPQLTTPTGLYEIWFDIGKTPQYYPLVHTTFWIEYQLWELDPTGFHFNNVMLHGLAAMCLWRLLKKLKVPGAWFAALLFAVHPVEVESVAWVTERKNVLSGFMYMLAALAYFRFTGTDGEAEKRSWKHYGFALLFFVGALLSKTVTASLPGAILVVLWWKRGSLKVRDFVPLVPFMLLGLVLGLTTAYLEKYHVGADGADWDLTYLERVLVAGRISLFYVTNILWPQPLIFFYERWDVSQAAPLQYFFPLAVAGILAFTWIKRDKIGRGWLAAFLFLGGTLVPALGFVDVYPMRFSYVADHFQYLAGIGVFVLIGAGFQKLADRENKFGIRNAGIAAIYLVLCTLTVRQIGAYQTLEILWRDTIKKNPEAWIAHNNLGILLKDRGDVVEAESCYREAISLLPNFVDARNNLGNLLMERGVERRAEGKTEEARRLFLEAKNLYEEALSFDPENKDRNKNVRVQINLATVFIELERYDDAIDLATVALETAPDHPDFLFKRGSAYWRLRRTVEAREDFERAIELDPRHYKAMTNLALAKAQSGDLRGAVDLFEEALELSPSNLEALQGICLSLVQLGERERALTRLKQLKRLDPKNELANQMLQRYAQ